jgi:Fe2+ or Zn2+ uptake regulation protein
MSAETRGPYGMRRTPQQMEIMNLLFAAMDRGEVMDTNKLWSRLSYKDRVWRQGMTQSLQHLEAHGMIHKKRRGCKPSLLTPTDLAYRLLRPTPVEIE